MYYKVKFLWTSLLKGYRKRTNFYFNSMAMPCKGAGRLSHVLINEVHKTPTLDPFGASSWELLRPPRIEGDCWGCSRSRWWTLPSWENRLIVSTWGKSLPLFWLTILGSSGFNIWRGGGFCPTNKSLRFCLRTCPQIYVNFHIIHFYNCYCKIANMSVKFIVSLCKLQIQRTTAAYLLAPY